MGLAFIMLFMGLKNKALRAMSLICGALCLAGFIGSFFSANLWYPAPAGCAPGFMIMCIYLMRKKEFA